MSWLFLTFLAAVLEAIAGIFDRYVLKNDLRNNNRQLLIFWGYLTALMFCSPAIITGQVIFYPWVTAIGLICGAMYLIAMNFYYQAVNGEEISRIAPILSLSPVLLLVLATIFFQEIHTQTQYLGTFIILIGVLIHAIDRQHHRLINKKALTWAILAALAFTIKSFLAKYLSVHDIDPLNVLFWIGLSILFFNIPLNFVWKKKFSSKKEKALGDLILAAALGASVTLIYTAAIMAGPAGVVAFLHRTEILFVFLISALLDFLNPKILQEKFIKADFLQKFFGVILILIGSFLLL